MSRKINTVDQELPRQNCQALLSDDHPRHRPNPVLNERHTQLRGGRRSRVGARDHELGARRERLLREALDDPGEAFEGGGNEFRDVVALAEERQRGGGFGHGPLGAGGDGQPQRAGFVRVLGGADGWVDEEVLGLADAAVRGVEALVFEPGEEDEEVDDGGAADGEGGVVVRVEEGGVGVGELGGEVAGVGGELGLGDGEDAEVA
ncbi:hypothetical protein BDV95DRAFT_594013 [Massariosphaeria phaeospora]|uniref:Uncharacterized protein n=1 Tax=Massariosphaeria phaeospora TaxID=100035 RepID=A0A7C8IF92_9PLEO|nr:hypothetical protein BDV95DRAFT_594013 [Massariosphaeria phaeospora]